MNNNTDSSIVTYSPHTHGTGVRVVETQTGRRGLVIRIEETGYEWIEPVVRWDREANGTIEESFSRGHLIIERS